MLCTLVDEVRGFPSTSILGWLAKIPITLIVPQKGERKAHPCEVGDYVNYAVQLHYSLLR